MIEITDWKFDYMFGLFKSQFDPSPYNDYRHLTITGRILLPKLSASIAEVTIFPVDQLNPSLVKSTDQPTAVGYISHRGKDYSANLDMPSDAFGLVLQMFIANRYRFVFIEAAKSFRGEAAIRHYYFSATRDEDGGL